MAKSCVFPHSLSSYSPSPLPLARLSRASGQPASWLSLLGNRHWNGVKGLMVSAKQVSRWRPACRPQTSGTKVSFSCRCVSIFSITTGSSMQAITFTGPPHSPQVSISILNTRLRRCAFMPLGYFHGTVPPGLLMPYQCGSHNQPNPSAHRHRQPWHTVIARR